MYADKSGHMGWLILASGLVSGGINAFATFINGGSPEEILDSAAYGAVTGALAAVSPNLSVAVSSYNLLDKLIDCMYEGYSYEDAIAILGITAVSEISFPSIGVDWLDAIAVKIFETGKNMASAGAEAGINQNANKENKNVETVSNQLFGMIAVGGGRALEVAEGWNGIRSIWLVP